MPAPLAVVDLNNAGWFVALLPSRQDKFSPIQ
jgi:hypothetical protein